MRESNACFLCFSVSVLVLITACAPKVVPVVTGSPKHTEFMFPTAPVGTPPALAGSLNRGWQYLQLDDFRNAEREFATALKAQPTFHPVETAMAYLALMGSLVAYSAYIYAIQHLRLSLVSLYAYVNPIIAVALGTLLLGEPLSGRIVMAAGLVLTGTAIVGRK